MRLTFTDDYDDLVAGKTYDIDQPQIIPSLLGTGNRTNSYAKIPDDFGPSDVRGLHDYGCIRAVADHLGVPDRTEDGKLVKKSELKATLIEELTDGG